MEKGMLCEHLLSVINAFNAMHKSKQTLNNSLLDDVKRAALSVLKMATMKVFILTTDDVTTCM